MGGWVADPAGGAVYESQLTHFFISVWIDDGDDDVVVT